MLNFYVRLRFVVVILFLSGLLSQGCNIINPAEKVPTYIHVDSFTFNSYLPGVTTSHNIVAVSAYYNNSAIGFFDLPATIPVLADGHGVLELYPVVPVDGLNSINVAYPFYRIDTFSFDPQPGKIIYCHPQTGFTSVTKVNKYSDFSGNTFFARWGGNKDLTLASDDSLKFDGTPTGTVVLSAAGDSSIDSSTIVFPIPAGQAFLEFDYKSEVPFYVGMQGLLGGIVSSQPYYLMGVKPSSTWKKFYINAADFNGQLRADEYRLYLKINLGDGQTRGRFLIDNIQLVNF